MALYCEYIHVPLRQWNSTYFRAFLTHFYRSESPSVYIGFSSLSAIDYCGNVGGNFNNITVGFSQGELSTITFSTVTGTPFFATTSLSDGNIITSLTSQIFYTPDGSAVLETTDLERNCSTIAGYTYIPGNPSNALSSSRTFVISCHRSR